MVYVLAKDGTPLMPTTNAKARKLLKKEKATVVSLKPFTIQLNYETTKPTQELTLGVDSGYLNIGFSVVSDEKEHICGEVKMLQGMSQRIQEKAMYRTQRRSRLRYRKPRWNNRKRKEGWLAPSIQHKLDTPIRLIEKIKLLLPISNVVIEVVNFDIQKIKNPDIQGEEYQQGEQMGFWNIREYVLHRDGHKCQNPDCKNKAEQPILEVHHVVFKSNGGTDTPSNLITLCNKCHTSENHKKGKFLYEWQTSKPKMKSFKNSTFMSIVRWRLVNIQNTLHTYGYITKNSRIRLGLEKTHYNDAFCIAAGTTQERIAPIEIQQVRRNNRSLEKFYDAKYVDTRTNNKVSASELNNGRRTRNKNENGENLKQYRGEKVSTGQRRIRTQRYFFQPNDLVKFKGEVLKVVGTMNKGKSVKLSNGKCPSPKNITPYKFSKGLVVL